MKINLSLINEIATADCDKPNELLVLKLINGFEIIIETALVPNISISNDAKGTFLRID